MVWSEQDAAWADGLSVAMPYAATHGHFLLHRKRHIAHRHTSWLPISRDSGSRSCPPHRLSRSHAGAEALKW